MADPRLPMLFSPLKTKRLELKNRLVMPAMGNRYASYYFKVTERLRRYYAEAAKGGVGLIVTQFTPIAPEGRSAPYFPALWDDSYIPGFRDMVADIHEAGAKAAVQLAHAGATTRSAVIGTRPVAPSAIALKGGEMPKALSTAEVSDLVERFAQAARRASEAGFDMVEFHAAHGYLLNQFLSPLWNQREDQYGGNTENRVRVIVEILQRTRQILGSDFPIMVRLCADEFVPGGITVDEGQRIARFLEVAGVDVLNVTGGIGESFAHSVPALSVPPLGSLVPLAAAVREVVSVPVVAVGKLQHPEVVEAILAQGKADLVALGRSLIADPYWPTKAAEGRWDEIRPCVGCASPDCHGRTSRNMDMACMVNPTVGRESLFATSVVQEPKRVLVVGGGAAGMEAATAASGRGHQVYLYEREQQLGGQLPLAAAPPEKQGLDSYLSYLKRAVELSSVQVSLGRAVTPELVQQLQPHIVIVATGSVATRPPVPVIGTQSATAREIVGGRVQAGEKVVVVGGGDVGCETAYYLAARGKQVTILEMLPDVAGELAWWRHDTLIQRLVEMEIEIFTNSQLVSVEKGSVTYRRGKILGRIDQVDTVVFATGAAAENELSKELTAAGFEVRLAGDCTAPANLGQAVRQGFEVGITIA